MDLKTYRLSLTPPIDQATAAARAKVSGPVFNTMELGTRYPSSETVLLIFRWSKGAVTPTDLFLTCWKRQGEKMRFRHKKKRLRRKK